jgi:Domain of unknown function (DUF4276)
VKMGIIAEADSDAAVISAITRGLLKPHAVGFKKFVSGGCGKLRRKCPAWAQNLVQQGCAWVVVVHDLDVHDELHLRSQLNSAVVPCGARASIVLIPKREIEAWLLYDSQAIAAAFNERARPTLPGNPEALWDPKKHLRDLIRRKYSKIYLNTVHNPLIAQRIVPSTLKGCGSFSPHFEFVARVRAALVALGPTGRSAASPRR